MNTILIIDDEISIRKIYKEVFEEEGYNALEASNAEDAINILKRGGINLILLDINLGDVDGDALYDIVSLFYKKIKVIVSSVCFVEDQKRYIKGAFDYYDKSEKIGILIDKVKKAFMYGAEKAQNNIGYFACKNTGYAAKPF